MQTGHSHRWRVLPDAGALMRFAVEHILRVAQEAIFRRGVFRIVLSGGATARSLHILLGKCSADWENWHIYFGDERCLPPQDGERNSKMASDTWLDHVLIPSGQVWAIPSELGATAATAAYKETLAGIGDFDLVVLGLGEDGHTASLFPSQYWGTEEDAPDVLAVLDSPKPPAERVSLSARRLSATREAVFLVSGEGKRQAVEAWRTGISLPAGAILPKRGVDILLDFCPTA